MKKLLMLLCCVFALNINAASGGTCSEVQLYLEGNQNYDDDEFLYKNDTEHEKAKNGMLNSTSRSGGNALVYECDRSSRGSNCGNRSVVTMEPGHWWNGERIDRKETYTCWTNNLVHWNDRWVPGNSACRIQGTEVAVGERYPADLTLSQCNGLRISDETYGTLFKAVCEEGPTAMCIAIRCVNGMVPNAEGRCIKGTTSKPDPNPTPTNPDDGESAGDRCAKTRSTNNGKACCYLKDFVAVYDEKNDQCICKNGGEFFTDSKGHGQCGPAPVQGPEPVQEPEPAPVPTPEPNPQQLFDCGSWNFENVPDCPAAATAIADLKKYCESTERNMDGFNTRVADIEKKIADCKANNESAAAGLRQRVEILFAGRPDLSGWRENLSVWKTSEGNFNGARLASDSIAGVVLGTAGGLITSHVVKKGQIKNGFEDIQCTIGGQSVAGWHDEFTVGIK